MVAKAYSDENREKFMTALQEFTTESNFLKLSSEKRTEYVYAEHEKAIKENIQPRPFVMTMKELTMLGFFTSKSGATEVLRYEAVPGKYNGCMPLSEVGRTWAT
jgi:putative sterol carrier protein